ncbi:MAG: RNA-guided endonuclease IscB [Candidatus Zixiibacteriota bacterium]
MQRVFVLDRNKKPLMPCTPGKARKLLKSGRAAVHRMKPFTVILKDREGGATQPVELKFDPGSKTTGIALVAQFLRGWTVIWAANLKHRGETIRKKLLVRRALRRGRRNRHTRYHAPKFENRTKPSGWLPPSIKSRVDNVLTWAMRIVTCVPISSISVETARFDTQKLQNPEISGVEYQRGELFGYEVREYLLEKWGRKCAYCGKKDVPLEIDHIQPRRLGGSDRVSNLTLSCTACNQAKGTQDVRTFLTNDIARLNRILSRAKAPLKDVAAINATRYAIGGALKPLALPVFFWSGGRTKYNRTVQGYPKDHWIDAACVGENGANVAISPKLIPLGISATGRGTRQVVKTDQFGFPRTKAGRVKRVFGFQTGDLVMLNKASGKHAGVHKGRLCGIRADGRFDISTEAGRITANWRRFTLIQRTDGYAYAG